MPDLQQLQAILEPLFPGLLGVRLREASADRVVAEMAVRAELCTTGQILHGGAQMAFADTLGAVGSFLTLPEGARTTTVESSTKFIRGVPLGTTIVGTCTPVHRGRTTQVWQTELATADGKLCALVTQTQLTVPAAK
ncbi:PaaI family thioesterase [Ramlibacter algicola]|uniref:PaaI family thioesterase n=1 Tax=Ramlibacter algicola TaxID=2795217 RepID=A0A934Q4K8_9BURK|nr:PaaI family thioesterase [Ramlibacter algicola]MBK0394506.1 PaaI family thioesterase [Ramlibacter algicola]